MSNTRQHYVHLRTTIAAALATALPLGMATATAEAVPPASTPDTSFGPVHTTAVEWSFKSKCQPNTSSQMDDAIGCLRGGRTVS
ncbi:hypothetical protein ACUY3S_11260 [Corynebacterium resistens]